MCFKGGGNEKSKIIHDKYIINKTETEKIKRHCICKKKISDRVKDDIKKRIRLNERRTHH